MVNSGLFANVTDGIRGDALAKNFVLFGGVITKAGGTKNMYSGLGGGAFGGAYGFQGGGNERGYVPMPGITECQFQYKNDGALATSICKTPFNVSMNLISCCIQLLKNSTALSSNLL